jgi:hypothetical protein
MLRLSWVNITVLTRTFERWEVVDRAGLKGAAKSQTHDSPPRGWRSWSPGVASLLVPIMVSPPLHLAAVVYISAGRSPDCRSIFGAEMSTETFRFHRKRR